MRHLITLTLCLTASLALAANGILELDSKPGGAVVFVDGKKKGMTPETEGQKLTMELAEGDHEVVIKKEGVGSATKKVFIGEGVIQPLTLTIMAEAFTNALGMKFVPVPIGRGKTLLFSVYETRYSDFNAFVSATKYDATKDRDGKMREQSWNHEQSWTINDNYPVTDVSWEDAQAFCHWLTKTEQESGKITAHHHYRLPTDHEWSCSVGIGSLEDASQSPATKSQKVPGYYWGSSWPPPDKVGNFGDRSLNKDNPFHAREENKSETLGLIYNDGYKYVSPVGSFQANELGLYDLEGNVQEWCQDLLYPSESSRVRRGSAWNHAFKETFVKSWRSGYAPDTRQGDLGFRCVLEQEASP